MLYPHPFHAELDSLPQAYAPWQLVAAEPQAPLPLEDTPFVYVDSAEALAAMVAELGACKHVAIDLEAHNYRSFQGFTCLMQVSSRTCDWVVDALALRAQLGPALARIMADAGIVKVRRARAGLEEMNGG